MDGGLPVNLAELEATVYDRLSFDAVPDATTVTRLRRYLNQEHHLLMGKRQMAPFRRSVLTFSTIANSPNVALPQAVSRIYSIQHRSNSRRLDEITLDALRDMDPGQVSGSGTPEAFIVTNYAAAVYRQVPSANQITVSSSSATDGATKTATIEGLTTGGYPRTASIALNGTSAVNFAGSDWIEIRKFSISLTAGGATTAAGIVTLYYGATATPGTELSIIPVGRAYPRYTQLHLFPYPTSAVTLYADVELQIEEMATASDEPYLPEDYHEILVEGALMRDYERREQMALYGQAKARKKELWNDLCLFLARQTTDMRERRWSQLGPYFPPGS